MLIATGIQRVPPLGRKASIGEESMSRCAPVVRCGACGPELMCERTRMSEQYCLQGAEKESTENEAGLIGQPSVPIPGIDGFFVCGPGHAPFGLPHTAATHARRCRCRCRATSGQRTARTTQIPAPR